MRHRLVVKKITTTTSGGQENREIDARVVPIFFFTIFFLLNSGMMRINLCAIVWWSRMSLSKRLVVSHYREKTLKKQTRCALAKLSVIGLTDTGELMKYTFSCIL